MNNRNVYMHGFVCDDAALFLDTHPDCPHAESHCFVQMPYLTAAGSGLMNHGHGKEVTANVGL